MAALSVETAGFPIETYRFHSSAEHEIACNWKTYVDNYAEGYHVRDIHPGLDRGDRSRNNTRCQMLRDRHAPCTRRRSVTGRTIRGLYGCGAWPNLGLNIFPTGMEYRTHGSARPAPHAAGL